MNEKTPTITELQEENRAFRAKNAKAALDEAVRAGRIPAQDFALKARWQTLLERDPANEVLLASLSPSSLLASPGRLTYTHDHGRLQASEGPARIIKAYEQLSAKARGVQDQSVIGFRQRADLAKEMAALYAKDIRANRDILDMPLMAASAADTLGTLSGTLVAQRTLELFKLQYPMLSRVYTDFGDMPAQYGQTISTRIVSVPSVQTYDGTLGADGRPLGWKTASAATTTDVPVTLDEHVGVPIVIDANTLGSTVRRLFDESAPAASYALSKYFVAKLYVLLTAAHFNGYAAVNGLKVPKAYASYKVTQDDFSRGHLAKISAIFNPNEVPLHDRSVLANSGYFNALSTDPSLVTFYAGQRAPEIITDNELPKLAGFVPIEAPDLPATGGMGAFAFQKSAIVAMTRLSNDYTQALPGASYGSVTTITDPDTGISVVLVQYVNHTQGYAEWRIQVMIGAGVGDKRAGLLITT